MDRQEKQDDLALPRRGITRRRVLAALGATAGAAAVGGGAFVLLRDSPFDAAASGVTSEVFRGGAPKGELWQLWKRRRWVKEAEHYRKLGKNIECKLCPNGCILEPGDRGRCRDRVHKEGKLYTIAYGNPCSFTPDPIEKKPLFHFLPGTRAYSIATAGCGFRCLNCQNWTLSQRKPDELKDPRGEEVLATVERMRRGLSRQDRDRLSMFPQHVVALAEATGCESIAYTYSEPTVWYEYMTDTARLARAKKIRNVWVTCGYINRKPLEELCKDLDAANVDLKSFDEGVYKKLNAGKLQPILDTLKVLKDKGVWFEVTNLVVPTYTDDLDMIRRMCDWLLKNVGADYPLHFSRFHPAHKLERLGPTPISVLVAARDVARKAGLRYVYIGNVRTIDAAETTVCPQCGKTVIDREIYEVRSTNLSNGKCNSCGTAIAGVWT